MLALAGCGLLAEPTPPELPVTAKHATHQEMVDDRATPRHPGDGGGTLTPQGAEPVGPVGGPLTLKGDFRVGPHGIAEGGALVVIPSPFWGWSAPHEVTLTAPDGVWFEERTVAGQRWATVRGRALVAEEADRACLSGRADRFAERGAAVWLGVDSDGDGVRSLVPQPLMATVTAGPPAQVVATLPSTAEPGSAVPLTLAVLDAAGNAGNPVPSRSRCGARRGWGCPPRSH